LSALNVEVPLNVLITSAGRRSSLTLGFKESAGPLGWRVLAAEVDALAPACALADGAFQVPRVTDPSYISCLLDICREQSVGLIIPTIDTELMVLAENQERFLQAGARAVVSEPRFIEICQDKWKTFQAMGAEGIAVPESWLPEHPFPRPMDRMFVKPRAGSASLNAFPATPGSLGHLLTLITDPIIQEFLDGSEVTIDAFLDFQGRPIHFVPRERIRTRGGESIQGVTTDLPELDAWVQGVLEACSRLGARGPITIQAFMTSRGPVLTEINPRFGGGFPLARAAGGDYPAWILALHRGETLEPRFGDYKRGLYMTRHYAEIFLETLPWAL
jgi:carbamoyl-phosphate synthase large subunit